MSQVISLPVIPIFVTADGGSGLIIATGHAELAALFPR